MKLEGNKIRDQIINESGRNIRRDNPPTLQVLQIGDNKISKKYIELKKKKSKSIGINFELIKFSENISSSEIIKVIRQSNKNEKIDGIMIQLPLPKNIDQSELISEIKKEKDIDGLRYCSNLESNFIPPVILAILHGLKESNVDLTTKNVVIIGNGFLVGKPLHNFLKNKSKNLVTISSKTNNKNELIVNADVIISATGSPWLIKKEMIKKNVVLIDAGTATMESKLVGDIHPDAYKKSLYYSPVPGGIGPLTVAMLIKNLIKAYTLRINK